MIQLNKLQRRGSRRHCVELCRYSYFSTCPSALATIRRLRGQQTLPQHRRGRLELGYTSGPSARYSTFLVSVTRLAAMGVSGPGSLLTCINFAPMIFSSMIHTSLLLHGVIAVVEISISVGSNTCSFCTVLTYVWESQISLNTQSPTTLVLAIINPALLYHLLGMAHRWRYSQNTAPQ